MKILAKDHSLCIQCGICEETCSKAYFKAEDSKKSCIQIKDEDISVCDQCGVCIDICPTQAINRDKLGVVRIRKKDCVGCFMCVGFCPSETMMQHDDHIEPFKCIACGLCAKACPTDAIYVTEVEKERKEKLVFA